LFKPYFPQQQLCFPEQSDGGFARSLANEQIHSNEERPIGPASAVIPAFAVGLLLLQDGQNAGHTVRTHNDQ
jgi:hypothetical protein